MKADIPAAVADFMAASTRDYILELLGETSLIDALVEPRVQRLIARGDVIPRDRLQLGVGLELGPVGLEQAARALVAAAGGIELPEAAGFTEALAALVAVLERVAAPVVVSSVADVADDADDEEAPPTEPVVNTQVCVVCNEPVDAEQALASKTRHRQILCAKDHATYDPKKRKAS